MSKKIYSKLSEDGLRKAMGSILKGMKKEGNDFVIYPELNIRFDSDRMKFENILEDNMKKNTIKRKR